MYIIYGHYCRETGKWYIGQSSQSLDKRSGENGSNYLKMKKGKYCNPKFANAIKKYGWDTFDHVILEENLTIENVDERETFWINSKDSYTNGYNASPIGNSCHFLTNEQKVKVSENLKSRKWSDEKRMKMSKKFSGEGNPFYGKKHSNEQKKKWSEKRSGENSIFFGKHRSEETKLKIANSQRGELSHLYGTHLSDETKRKISEANRGKVRFSKKVALLIDNKIYMTFKSAADAARFVGLKCSSHISFSCKGKTNGLVGGFKWLYTDIEIQPNDDDMLTIKNRINEFKKYKR